MSEEKRASLTELERNYRKVSSIAVGLEFNLFAHSKSLSRKKRAKMRAEIKEMSKKYHEAYTAFHEAIPGLKEFENTRMSDPQAVFEAFLRIPRRWRTIALDRGWGWLFDLAKEGKLEERDKSFLETAEKLKRLTRADVIDDVDAPTQTQAFNILRRYKERLNKTWSEVITVLDRGVET